MRLLYIITLSLLFITINARAIEDNALKADNGDNTLSEGNNQELDGKDDTRDLINEVSQVMDKRSAGSNIIPIIVSNEENAREERSLKEKRQKSRNKNKKQNKNKNKKQNKNKNKKNKNKNKFQEDKKIKNENEKKPTCLCNDEKCLNPEARKKIAKLNQIPPNFKAVLTKITSKNKNKGKEISAQTIYSSEKKKALLVKTKADKKNAKQFNQLYLFGKNKSFEWVKKGKSCRINTLDKNTKHIPTFLIGMAEGKKEKGSRGQEKYVKKVHGTKYITVTSKKDGGQKQKPMSAEIVSKKGVTLYEVNDFEASSSKIKYSVPKICKY